MRHPDLGMFIPPNLEALGADARELREALARLEKYANERRAISHQLQGHFRTLEEAREKDSRAYAEAIKAGKKKVPEEENVREVEAEREALERRDRALEVVVQELRTEARTLIEEHREDWRRQSEGALQGAQERYAAAIEELVAARGSFYATWSTVDWLEDPNRKYTPKGGEANVTLNLDKSPGAKPRQQAPVTPILDAMRWELGAPERRRADTVRLVEAEPGDEREAG